MAQRSTITTCPTCGTKNRVRASPSGVPRCSVCQTLLPWIVEAGADTFEEEIASSVPVLVDFWAHGAAHVAWSSPLVERLGSEHAGSLKVVKLNVDGAPAISARFGVQGIPLLVLIRDGSEVDRLVGAVPLQQLQAWVEPHLAPVAERGSAI